MCALDIELSYADFFLRTLLKQNVMKLLFSLGIIKATMRIRDYLHSVLIEITIYQLYNSSNKQLIKKYI